MIERICVIPLNIDSRSHIYQASFNRLDLSSNVTAVKLADSYIINAAISKNDLTHIACMLTNTAIETSEIGSLPSYTDFDFLCEIGYLPGVTDNVGHTAQEGIADLLQYKFGEYEGVYTSRIFFISGKITRSDAEKIAFSLHNPLIERAGIMSARDLARAQSIPLVVPRVDLHAKTPVIKVSLEVADNELEKIGKEGICDPDGSRRGPLALDLVSMKAIKDHFSMLRRDPTDIELESLAQTWSEHCKHTIFANSIDDISEGLYEKYIKGATNRIRKEKGDADFCISVFSDNAGAIRFDATHMVTHKVETHNSPSALDPFGGSITGIIGVNRDTIGFGLGAKPVANVYGFYFGYPEDARPLYLDKARTKQMLPPRRIIDGVVKGVNVGGNCSGIPTLSGFVRYDERFRGKPVVFVGTVGLMPNKVHGAPAHKKGAKNGDFIVMVGGKVGADGIHGATFSSVTLDSSSPATAVQIGDPITQKKLSDALVKEARDRNLYTSITDNGAGGLSCSVAEMAKECGGFVVDIEKVSLKYQGLSPWQIWISESQERMTLSVPKSRWNEFHALMESRGVHAVRIGQFTHKRTCIVRYQGSVIMDMSMDFLHHGLPNRHQQTEMRASISQDPIVPKRSSYEQDLLALLSNLNISSHEWVSQQYDHEVQASSVVKPLVGRGRLSTNAQVFRPLLNSQKGVVLSFGEYPSYSDMSAYHMAACAIDTAIRNAISVGASLDTLAILDNTCWCSSREPYRLSQLVDAMKACYDYAVGYGTPFISGKDSMFNDFKGFDKNGKPTMISIPPTLLISAIGVIPDIHNCVSPEFKMAGDHIYVLGETNDELGASEYYKMLANSDISKIGTRVPHVDYKKNSAVYRALERAIRLGLVASSLSITSGGLGIALAKAALGGRLGLNIDLAHLKGTTTTFHAKVFSESQGRILVTVENRNAIVFEKIMANVSFTRLGKTTMKDCCVITHNTKVLIKTQVSKLHAAYHAYSDNMNHV